MIKDVIKAVWEKIANPIYLFYVVYTLILVFFAFPTYAEHVGIDKKWIFVFKILLVFISLLFIHKIIFSVLSPSALLSIRIQSFKLKPEKALFYLIKESEKWINSALKFINISKSDSNSNKLKRIKRDLEYRERNFSNMFKMISEQSFHTEPEIIGKLIGITESDPLSFNNLIRYNKANNIDKEKEWLESRQERLNRLKGFKDVIPNILRILGTPPKGASAPASTGISLTVSTEILKKSKDVEELKWLIRFVNVRPGFELAELLGLRVQWGVVKWHNKEVVKISTPNDYVTAFSDRGYLYPIDSAESLFRNFPNISAINKSRGNLVEIIGDLSGRVNEKVANMVDYEDVMLFLSEFEKNREQALESIWKFFSEWYWQDLAKDLRQRKPIAIALTYGYSFVLEFILDNILKKAKEQGFDVRQIQLLFIKSEKYGQEELLEAKLKNLHRGLICSIMSPETIKDRALKIEKVFIGIESINIKGDIVHPRGNVEVIKGLRDAYRQLNVFAFGETYKVKDFDEIFIDFTRLACCRSENINYVVTDHGIHHLQDGQWKLFDNSTMQWRGIENLNCCLEHWQSSLLNYVKR